MADDRQDFDSLGIAIKRIEGENAEAYQAFLQYAWLQGSERNVTRVAEITGFVLSTIKIWCKDWEWVDRASVIDGIRWTHQYQQRQEILKKDNIEFAEANRKLKEKGLSAANKMIDTALHLLESAGIVDDIVETDMIETKDGRFVPATTQIIMKSKVSDIPRLVDTGIKVGRLVQDLPTEIIEDRIPIGADLSSMSTEEIYALRDQNQRELREKGVNAPQNVSDAEN